MSKKRKKAGANKSPAPRPRGPSASKAGVVAALALLCVAAAGAASMWWTPARPGPTTGAAVEPARQQGSLALSKEYIYSGGRLVATEEPQPAGPAPTGLNAFAASTAGVDLNWAAPASGAVNHYIVERRQLAGGALTTLTENATQTSYHDATAAPDTAYLYYVRAAFEGGTVSVESAPDLATTVAFSEPLVAAVTTIKASHLTELRRAVNAVRGLAGLAPASWSYPDPASDPPSQRRGIYLEDVTDLRSQLGEALDALNLPTTYPPEPLLARGAPVRAAHFEQIRERVR